MQPKLLPLDKILKSNDPGREYTRVEFNGVNESGFEPIGDKVLILPDQASEITSGGIMLTAEMIERHTLAAETGVIVSVGDGAFSFHTDGSKWQGRKPVAGDRIYCQRYSGIVLFGADGRFYRLMDTSVIGAVEKPR